MNGRDSLGKKPNAGLLTERGNRGSTLSPTSLAGKNEGDRRLTERMLSPTQATEWNEKEEPYIKKWIDYSNKYGIAYILTNEICGVYYNDNSKIALHPDNYTFDYFEKGLDR